jgi:hypothetical protein
MIKISVKGLAKFMTSGSVGQRNVLRNFKFPDPEGGVQAVYYSEARLTIKEFHESGNNPSSIVSEVKKLTEKAYQANPKSRIRIEHNIRALRQYLKIFGGLPFKVVPSPKLALVQGDVSIGATPDFCAKHKGTKKLVKLDLGTKPADPKVVKIILQVIYEAAKGGIPNLEPRDVLYLDVPGEKIHKTAKTKSRLTKEIQAACQNIEALWPSIR